MSQSLYGFLKEKEESLQKSLQSSRRLLNLLSLSRVFLFLFAVTSFYSFLGTENAWLFSIPLLAFLLFLRALSAYLDLKQQRKFLQHFLDEVQLDLNYHRSQSLNRPHYDYHANPDHPYARELNLFGDHSLHHRIDRSFNASGAKAIARSMEQIDGESVQHKQAFFQELMQDRARNYEIRARGRELKEASDLKLKLTAWSKQSFTAIPKLLWPFIVLGSLNALFRLYQLIMQANSDTVQAFVYAVAFNLVLLMMRMPVIRKQQAILGQISEPMKVVGELLALVQKAPYQSALGLDFLSTINTPLSASREIKRLSAFLASLDQMANAVVLVLVNALFPYHLFRLRSLEQWHHKQSQHLVPWLEAVDEFQVNLSFSNFCDQHEDFTWPELTEDLALEAEALGHPLIKSSQRVTNDLSMSNQKFIILTGSNMSGKSTFLRTLGLNLLMAQMGLKVCARSFKAYPFQVMASMNPSDDLMDNRSYFQAEVIRLKALSDKLSEERWSFLILDEILRGTNSDDKREGTRRFLQSLVPKPALGIVATHDVDIANLADQDERFAPFFFESTVEGQQLKFDYKLRPGVCRTPNANLLMKNYGLFDNAD